MCVCVCVYGISWCCYYYTLFLQPRFPILPVSRSSSFSHIHTHTLSFNVFVADPTTAVMTSLHFYTWKSGLKTGMYYLRSRPAVDAIKFTVDTALVGLGGRVATAVTDPANASEEAVAAESERPPQGDDEEEDEGNFVCTRQAGCLMCGS